MEPKRRDDSPLYAAMFLFAFLLVLLSAGQASQDQRTTPADPNPTTEAVSTETTTETANPGEVEDLGDTEAVETVKPGETDPEEPAETSTTSPDDGSTDSVLDKIPIVGDVVALGNSTLPQVTDYSYFRLAQQGQARLIPGLDHLTLQDFDYGILPEVCQFSSDATEMFYFSEEQILAEPGTIISTLDCGTAEVTISVPVLPEALQEFIDQRGERCLMSYAKYKDDNNTISIEAEVMVYSGVPQIMVNPQHEMFVVSVYDNGYRNSMFYELRHDVYRSQCEASDTLVTSDASLYCYMGSNFYDSISEDDRVYPYTCMVNSLKGQIIDDYSNEDALALGVSECTSTSFTPTAAQIERLIAAVEEFEARPLPDKFFAKGRS